MKDDTTRAILGALSSSDTEVVCDFMGLAVDQNAEPATLIPLGPLPNEKAPLQGNGALDQT